MRLSILWQAEEQACNDREQGSLCPPCLWSAVRDTNAACTRRSVSMKLARLNTRRRVTKRGPLPSVWVAVCARAVLNRWGGSGRVTSDEIRGTRVPGEELDVFAAV